MKIEIFTSANLDEKLLESYTKAFNIVFKKDFKIEFLRNKYFSTFKRFSYHSLFIDETDNSVAGGCTAMPIKCMVGKKSLTAALLVDVFIVEKYRKNPLTLYKMYKKLAECLLYDGFSFVLAVPNGIAYPYWKNIVKFKDIGRLNYWIMPVKIGNIIKKFKFLNFFSGIFCRFVLGISFLMANIKDGKNKQRKYFQPKDREFLKNRFPENSYKRFNNRDIELYYKIIDEDGVNAAYIFYATKDGVFCHKALNAAVSHILKKETADIIFYIGQIDFMQACLVKVPRKIEPKLLPLTCNVLVDDADIKDITDISLWDFGLVNYDVR